ncbi:hypothetical protein LK542_10985 [Massilia sp. IC2-477]|uniref:hypothetical protein n=1 Tax=unclassified Massilia TaxID=2609279 RepID=UPI001D11A5A6|nr:MULTISPECIES: hypothetical protein [unclassified Massilia]MCC2956140.1 hypothetical protein [Massilia sp. IC2-477]MCC2970725.1 hypothetical protein [Massilia sp. IC2-476]
MNTIHIAQARHFPKRRPGRKQRVNVYPLLGLLLVALAAVLGYGALYFLLWG